ncbi:MAG TPA: hypothetical protein V6D19_06515 [Stenomitos sp.]
MDIELSQVSLTEGCQVVCPKCSATAILNGTSDPRSLLQGSLEQLLPSHKLVSLKRIDLGALELLPDEQALGVTSANSGLLHGFGDASFLNISEMSL